MSRTLRSLIPAVLLLCVLCSACGTGSPNEPQDDADSIAFDGLMLSDSSVLITNSAQTLLKGSLITLTFPEDIPAPAVGSLYAYTIDAAIRESYPPQASVLAAEEIESLAGHTLITFGTAESILLHLPQNTRLIDVRTSEEYAAGHLSGALNIPLQQIEADMASAVPEPSDIVIVYCRSGNRSAQAGAILENMGYLVILDAGGIIDYRGKQVMGSEPGPLPGQS